MSLTHIITETIRYDDGEGSTVSKSRTDSQTAGESKELSEPVPDSSTDLAIAFTLDISQMKTFYIWSDVAMTVETNSGSAPDDTFTLVANVAQYWSAGTGETNPITADVTANVYATNASGSAGTLHIRALQDPTP